MNHYCEQCIKSITNTNYIIDNPDFFDINKMYEDHNTNHNRKIVSYLIKSYIKLSFNNPNLPIKTQFHYNTLIIHMKSSLLYWIEYFDIKGYKFSRIIEMNMKTLSDKNYLIPSEYMYVLIFSDEYDNITFTNCTDLDVIIPTFLLTIPCGLLFLWLMSSMIYILNKPLITNK